MGDAKSPAFTHVLVLMTGLSEQETPEELGKLRAALDTALQADLLDSERIQALALRAYAVLTLSSGPPAARGIGRLATSPQA